MPASSNVRVCKVARAGCETRVLHPCWLRGTHGQEKHHSHSQHQDRVRAQGGQQVPEGPCATQRVLPSSSSSSSSWPSPKASAAARSRARVQLQCWAAMPAPQQAQRGYARFIYTNALSPPSCPSLDAACVWLGPPTLPAAPSRSPSCSQQGCEQLPLQLRAPPARPYFLR